MRFKLFFVLSLGLFVLQPGFGLDKWNILLGNLRDLSSAKDKNTGVIIQKSISAQLQKQAGFNLLQSRTNLVIQNFQAALDSGRAFKADIILYGDYYIEGEDLVIVVDVFDVLENRLKMRKYYSGAVDLDIFDTIDSMTADMVLKIKEALPELTAENQVRIRQVRQNIYETEKVSIKRMFYTRFGFYTELGPKQYFKIGSMGSYSFPDYAATAGLGNSFAFSSIPVGAALRLWDFRLDILVSGLPGVPQIAWQNGDYFYDSLPSSIFFMTFSYYLPWFNNSLALSIGNFDMAKIKMIDYNYSKKEFNSTTLGGSETGFSMSFGLLWNPTPDLELSLNVTPFMTNSYIQVGMDKMNPNDTNFRYFRRDFPALSVGCIYFLGNFGLELKAFVDPYHYTEFTLRPDGSTNFNNNDGAVYNNMTAAGIYAGLVYRVDFLK